MGLISTSAHMATLIPTSPTSGGGGCSLIPGNAVATGGVVSVDSGACKIVHTFSSSGTFSLSSVGILRCDVAFTGTGSFGGVSSDGEAFADPADTTVTVTSGEVTVTYDPVDDFVTGMSCFFDPSVSATITDTGGLVDSHADLTSTYTATPNTTSNRPVTGTRTINSLNGFDYIPTNDCLQVASFPTSPTFAFFTVMKFDSLASYKIAIEQGNGTASGRGLAFWAEGGNKLTAIVTGTAQGFKTYDFTDTTTAHALTIECDGTQAGISLRVDGATPSLSTQGGSNPGTSAATQTLNIGARNGGAAHGFDGIYGPLIAFHDGNKPGAAKRAIVENYLSAKWGTP